MRARKPEPGDRSHPRSLDPKVAAAVDELDEDAREWFEERAAIIEFDGNVPRRMAEREALRQTREWLEERRAGRNGAPD